MRGKAKSALAGALAMVWCLVMLAPVGAAQNPSPVPRPKVQQQPAWARSMLAAVNAERTKAGVGLLTLCAPLITAAEKYAQVMASTGRFEHVGIDGKQPWDRGTAEGYRYRTYGENIAAGQGSVASVMESWIHSPGHYANLVKGTYTHVGFGHALLAGTEYQDYWVQNFGSGGKC